MKVFVPLARVLSCALHPMFMPLYCCLLVLYGNSIFSFAPAPVKLTALLVLGGLTVGVPSLAILLLKRFGLVGGYALESQEDRGLPLLITALAYFAAMVLFSHYIGQILARKLFIGATFSLLLALIITPFWKISLHAIGIGGAIALLCAVTFLGYAALTGWIFAGFLLAGALLSSRLLLGRHNAWQALAGFALGFGVMLAFSYFF